MSNSSKAIRRAVAGLFAGAALLASTLPTLAGIIGPDVSSWQHPNGASIDWTQVKANGHSFAFVKATEGTTYTNPHFAADWAAVASAGMDRGAYHFADPSTPAAVQADYFIGVAGNSRHAGDLPPVLDLETNPSNLSPADLVAWTHAFLDRVETLIGPNRKPIIYSYPYFWTHSMGNTTDFSAANYPLWLANYTGGATPSFPLPGGWTSWTFWQYTDKGKVPGISSAVDVSHYCCDFASLQTLAFGSQTSQAPPAPPLGGTDLYAVATSGTASGSVEIHALGQAGHYSGFIMHTGTALPVTSAADEWQYQVASLGGDGQPDLFAIHERNTASHRVEVHVLSAASGYRTWILHAATPVAEVLQPGRIQFTFASLDADHRANLYAIILNNTASNRVEVHALSEASNYSTWVLHSATAFPPVTAGWQFRIGDRAGNGNLIGISHAATTSNLTEIHALARSSGYQSFAIHIATPLGYTTDAQIAFSLGDHDNDGIPDLYAVQMNGTSSNQTEVHILSGASGYGSWSEHAVSGLQTTTQSGWQFSAH